ncbi:MAG: hypothetical protein JWN86_1637 [Planctomycetota bacterium]|nr:hypothetical protein [Planctomycetota bacterium]
MTTPRLRATRPKIVLLEPRLLLAAVSPSAAWIGQDGKDLVGPSSAPGSDQVQDIHIAVAGLSPLRTVVAADILGLGGGSWQYPGGRNSWAAAIVRNAGASTADVYVEPSQSETGRPFEMVLTYDDNTKSDLWFHGGTADPNLRMPSAVATLGWIGQDGHDLVGLGPSVGPDGVQDLRWTLGNLSATTPVTDVTIVSSGGSYWASGTNPSGFANASMSQNGSVADLYINPYGDPSGQTFTATITYANHKTDTVTATAGHADPNLAQPATAGPIPTLQGPVTASWIGQDGSDLMGPGSARIALSGLPAGRSIVAAALSDSSRGLWVYRGASGGSFYSDPWSGPLGFRTTSAGADIGFPPDRDEAGATLTLRLAFDDGTTSVTQLLASTTDPGRREPGPAASSVVAHPGDNLNDLANRFGTVRLSAGIYALSSPLILNQPVAIVADPGVTLQFSQAASEPAWSTAIKIHAGHTTLDGFSVRFATPVRWADNVSYGPAVIGTTDNLDSGHNALKVGLLLRNLDLQSPPVLSGNVEAPRLIRLASGLDGRIEGNTLKGGATEFLNGPWTIVNNNYLGTVPNTYCWNAFAGHNTHDVIIQGNTAQPQGASGRTWRFAVLSGSGFNDSISSNLVVGIGPRDGDPVDMNAAEIILTESYSLQFEGMPTGISSGGLVLQIPPPQGGPAHTGDMVAILSGPAAGTYRRIAQALGPQTYLMDTPLPSGNYAISIASGFVGETFQGNTIDTRGSTGAGDLVLVGNHFGTKVLNNHLLGGAAGFRITAAPSEHPETWGWSHAPFLNATIDGNIIEDSPGGASLAVEHSSVIKSNAGRVYFSGSLTNNTVVWSSSFLSARGGATGLTGLVVGDPGSLDPGELVLTTGGNTASVPTGTIPPPLKVLAGRIDGQVVRAQTRSLPAAVLPAPSGLSLVNDTGLGDQDRITMDGRLRFDPVSGAVGYEYLVSGAAAYLPVNSPSGFLPAGLTQVSNTIWLRAIDAQGRRSPESTYQFMLDNSPPINSIPFLKPSNDTGISATDRITRVVNPEFDVTGDPTDTMILLANGVEIARRVGTGSLRDPISRADGSYGYSLHRLDAAGNASDSAVMTLTIDATAPSAVANLTIQPDGRVSFSPTGRDDSYEYQVGTSGAFISIDRQTSFSTTAGGNIGVRAVDVAGNIGPETWVALASSSTPSGVWLGQDGRDLVGPGSPGKPDGIQDIHVVLNGLRSDRAIVFIDIQGLGGSRWQFGGQSGPWKAVLVRSPGATTADLYLQPDRIETGRPFSVTVQYNDGSRAAFWISGGAANPALHVPAAPGVTRTGKTPNVASRKALAHARSKPKPRPITSHKGPIAKATLNRVAHPRKKK